ncbi:Alanine racemase [Moorella glycerini]|uniref:Alanine racemase n=1 Tax=Neomoorella stamsii TaxID=1266720 RepID=A0A9X7J0R7_9FIRM|nr:Serine/alanine racemase [Moorella stamsii]CEP68410.1 Alanine racemase [Moorella glycerini]
MELSISFFYCMPLFDVNYSLNIGWCQSPVDLAKLTRLAGPRWIEIEATALEHNLRAVKGLLQPPTRLLAVIKADAYGAGAVEAARIFLATGADYLGVTTLAEGQELRRAGITAPILLMSPLLPEELPQALTNDLTLTISSRSGAEAAAAAAAMVGRQARVHLKVETGLQRTGLEPGEVVPLAREMRCWPGVQLEGIYSHLAEAAHPGAARRQMECFQRVLMELEEQQISLPLKHICNSTGLLLHRGMHLDMVRAGTLLYGQFPYQAPRRGLELKNPWQFKARILFIHDVAAGTPVGYGGDYVVKKATRLAVIPVGYADGFALTPVSRPKDLNDLARHLVKTILAYLGRGGGEGTAVTIAGQRAPVVGRVGMQLSMVDVGHLPEVKVGQEVQLDLRRPTASARLPRVYCREGQPYLVRTTSGEMVPVLSSAGQNLAPGAGI